MSNEGEGRFTLPKDKHKQTFQALQPRVTQAIAVATASAAISNAVTSTVVRIATDTDCFVVFATTPTATSSHMLLPAGTVEYFKITFGHKVAAIRDTADGNLSVTEME